MDLAEFERLFARWRDGMAGTIIRGQRVVTVGIGYDGIGQEGPCCTLSALLASHQHDDPLDSLVAELRGEAAPDEASVSFASLEDLAEAIADGRPLPWRLADE